MYELLSKKGKAIYFPRKGILAQGMAAKDKEINATIGTAYEDDGKPHGFAQYCQSHCNSMVKMLSLMPQAQGIKPLRDKWQELTEEKKSFPRVKRNQFAGGDLRRDPRPEYGRLYVCRRKR